MVPIHLTAQNTYLWSARNPAFTMAIWSCWTNHGNDLHEDTHIPYHTCTD